MTAPARHAPNAGFSLVESMIGLSIILLIGMTVLTFARQSRQQMALDVARAENQGFEGLLRGQIHATVKDWMRRREDPVNPGQFIPIATHCMNQPIMESWSIETPQSSHMGTDDIPPIMPPAGSPRFWAPSRRDSANPNSSMSLDWLYPWDWIWIQGRAAIAELPTPPAQDSIQRIAMNTIDRCYWTSSYSAYAVNNHLGMPLPNCVYLQNYGPYHMNLTGSEHGKFVIAWLRAQLWDYSTDKRIDPVNPAASDEQMQASMCQQYAESKNRGVRVAYTLTWNIGRNNRKVPNVPIRGVVLRAKSGIVDIPAAD
jgi:hypothetical protein